MNKLANFYLELFKALASIIIFFAIFGNMNDLIVTILSPQSSTISMLMEEQLVYQVVFIGQFLGAIILISIIYLNRKALIFWLKEKKQQNPLNHSTKLSVISAIGLIIFPYVCLLIS